MIGNFDMGSVDQVIQALTRARGGSAQHALLGDIAFDLITYFEGMEFKFGANYAEHALIEGKPRLQFVGNNLESLSWELVFHAGFCQPELEVLKLRMAVERHQALPLVFASGEHKGWFVPLEASAATRQSMRDGVPIWIEVKLTLQEYVAPRVLVERTQVQAPVAVEKPAANGKRQPPARTVNKTASPRPTSASPVRTCR